MKKLNKLAKAATGPEKRQIAHAELCKVQPQKFKRAHEGKDIDVEIVSVATENVAGHELLKVLARAWRDGVEVPVDNPLYYKNAPIMVPDGTFETLPGGTRMANFHEDAEEALRLIVYETLKVTALK